MKLLVKVGFIIAISIIFIMVIGLRMDMIDKEIDRWASEHNYKVVHTDMQMTIFGSPFYYLNKGEYIYKIELDNGDIWWLRTGVFSNDYEKEPKS